MMQGPTEAGGAKTQLGAPPSCVLMGEGSLLIPCAEILLRHGCHLLGIVSANTDVLAWASQKDLTSATPDTGIPGFMAVIPFDYLFSVVNPLILSEAILALPRKGAINFHDGPLPRYAGVHATSWAIINQEPTHAVTWHWMTRRVDEGDILQQPRIDIDADDTALTLNAKCYELAVRSFAELVPQLIGGAVSSLKQNLRARTYYGKHEIPSGACVLLWSQPADRISALVRGLTFGPIDNPLGLPKLVIERDVLIVADLAVTGLRSGERPGTITAIGNDFVQVATSSQDVLIREMIPLNGKLASIVELAQQYDLRRGQVLPEPDETTIGRLTELSRVIHRHDSFWRHRLSDLNPVEIAHQKRGRTAEPPEYRTVPIPISEAVSTFAMEQGISLAEFVIGAFTVFLARLSESSTFDLGFTRPQLQREVAHHENMFVARVPLRVSFSSGDTFATALESVRSQLALVIQHKTYARDIVLRFSALAAIREQSAQSLLPINVDLVEAVVDHTPASASLLTLVIEMEAPRCHWAYDASWMDADQMARMARRFATFLTGNVSGKRQNIHMIPLLADAELHQLIVEWNNTGRVYPSLSVHRLFEEQAAQTPDTIALVQASTTSGDNDGDTQVTYRELNGRANQLAHYLRKHGVGSEVLVGISMDRSIEMVIGLLGILKAGGAYVPLDPSLPKERLEFMIQDAAPGMILNHSAQEFGTESQAPIVVRLDHQWGSIAQESRNNPRNDDSDDNLAYVIYTSGSTGKPKGVTIPHRGVARLLFGGDYARFGPDHCFLHLSSTAFDVSVWELWGALLHGARCVLFPGCFPGPEAVHNVIHEQGVDSLFLITPLFNLIVDEAPRALSEVTQLLIGGEALSAPHVFRGLQYLPTTQLINVYGPTESTVFASAYPILKHIDTTLGSIPIGRPIANTTIYILDRWLNPSAIEGSGQVCIGGAGLARGYLNRARLSAQAFVPDPWGSAGSRLYTTGDRARILSDGNIDFEGRLDHQVKIRGFRIELGEIEAVLAGHPRVHEAVVVAREERRAQSIEDKGPPDGKRLVAYLVTDAARPDGVELKKFLCPILPAYMIPQAFVVLDRMPVMPNGKLDRKALPKPDEWRPHPKEPCVKPGTGTEELLLGIWLDVLGLEQIGIDDDFFELGGHSLLATRIISRVREAFAIDLPLQTLFERPTIAGLAELLDTIQWATESSGAAHLPGSGGMEEEVF